MNTLRFTKAALLELPIPAEGKRAEYADTAVNGLRLRITSNGTRSFCVVRKRDGKFYRLTLGKFPDLTIDQARELASRTLGEVAATRQNPNQKRREEENKSITLAAALAEYVESRRQRIKQTTIDQYQGIIPISVLIGSIRLWQRLTGSV